MSLANKLQLKPGQRLMVLFRPQDVALGLAEAIEASAPGPGGAETVGLEEADAVLAFVSRQDEVTERCASVVAAAQRDALAWVAYPKAGRLGTDLNRDILNGMMHELGARGVRQVAIDDTWSALRFRPLLR